MNIDQKDTTRVEAEAVLNSVGLPISDQAVNTVRSMADRIGFHLAALMTDDLTKEIWGKWYPNQIQRLQSRDFRSALRELFADGLSIGFSVNRFREISRNLPDPIEGSINWIPYFEDAIEGKNNCSLRLCLSTTQFQKYNEDRSGSSDSDQTFDGMLDTMRDGLFYELGIILPIFEVLEEDTLPENEIRIEWNDLRLPSRKIIGADQILVNDTPERLRLLNITGERTTNPANGNECAFVDAAMRSICEDTGLTTWDDRGYIVLLLSNCIRRGAASFVNRYFLEYILSSLEQAFPILIKKIREHFDGDMLVQILRGLLQEEISIRDLRKILDCLLSANMTLSDDHGDISLSKHILFFHNASSPVLTHRARRFYQLTPTDYISHVRTELKQYISHKYTRSQNTLIVYLIDPQTESRLLQPKPLTASEKDSLLNSFQTEVDSLPSTATNPVVLTTLQIRHLLRQEIFHDFPNLAVLSYHELSPDMNIQPIARIDPQLEPYDESLYHFIESLPELTTLTEMEPFETTHTLNQSNEKLIRFLEGQKKEIISLVCKQLSEKRSDHPQPKNRHSDTPFQDFLEILYDGYLDLLVLERSQRLKTLFKQIASILMSSKIDYHDFFKIHLNLQEEIRKKLFEFETEFDSEQIRQLLISLESVADQVVDQFLSVNFQWNFKLTSP